ncbi:MAG: glycoside hydrolase family 9 protein [Defluviitaleaceae bacterium]|nr:glycoside hydrolase family 9 protein [Defluviitaleaceae bacterium]
MKKRFAVLFFVFTAMFSSNVLANEINYARLLQTSLYFFDSNMCGGNVGERSCFAWRNNCHLQDRNVSIPVAFRGTSGLTTMDLSGGFHDAGDHVKFNLPIAVAGITVGLAVYEYRDQFERVGSLDHAQRILDHFAEYYKRCVVWNSNGTIAAFAYQVSDGGGGNDHGYWGPPELQTGNAIGANRNARFTNLTSDNPGTDQVAIAAALLAQNYVNFGDAEDLRVATALFDWTRQSSTNNGVAKSGAAPFYDSTRWEDKVALAAEWLFVATNNSRFRDASMTLGANGWEHHTTWPMTWDGVWQQVNVMRGLRGVTSSGQGWEAVRANMNNINTSSTTFFHAAGWGSSRYNCGFQALGLIHDRRNPSNVRYTNWAQRQMAFILGANPLNNSYVLGYPSIGTGTPRHSAAEILVHHRAATGFTDGWTSFNNGVRPRNLLTGALIGGPSDAAYGVFPNNYDDYVTSEVACDYNANLVIAAAAHLHNFPAHQPVPLSQLPGNFREIVPSVETARARLAAAIARAQELLDDTEESADGTNIARNIFWATPQNKNIFNNAKNSAQNILDNANATVETLTAARITLENATTLFESQRALGTFGPIMYTMTVTFHNMAGASFHPAGEEIVLCAGSRNDGFIFDAWTGADASLLANRNASVTTFEMPARDVSFTATWKKISGADEIFPMEIRLIGNANERGFYSDGHNNSANGRPGDVHPLPFLPRTFHVNPGQYTFVLGTGAEWGIQTPDTRWIEITVSDDGEVSVNRTATGEPWSQSWATPGSGRVSHRSDTPGVNFISTGTLPSGHTEGSFPTKPVETFSVTVLSSRAQVTGAGNYPEGHIVAINAGTPPVGWRFSTWSNLLPGLNLDDRLNSITYFVMPAHDVTIVANWESTTLPIANVTFQLNGGELVSGNLLQSIPHNSNAIEPIVKRNGYVFNGWDKSYFNITEDTTFTAQWLRLGAVSSHGNGDVTSADAVWLARHLAGHEGFEINSANDASHFRVADMNGDGEICTRDLMILVRWLVGYDLEELQTS